MSITNDALPPRLQEIVADFQICQGREKLEYLLEFSEGLPELPEWLHEDREQMGQVHECMTPVFVFAEDDGDKVQFHFDVPPESPTVRGYAEILRQGTAGLSRPEVLAIPDDFYLKMGMQDVLSGQRLSGLGAILRYVKRLAADEGQEEGQKENGNG